MSDKTPQRTQEQKRLMWERGIRHTRGTVPTDYLEKWLHQFRPYAYATEDDSWGELEKLLDIVAAKLERERR